MRTDPGVQSNSIEGDMQVCPNCGAGIPVHKGFKTWCECGWNLYSHRPNAPYTFIETIYEKVGKKIGNLNLQRISEAEKLQSTMTLSKFFAYLIAICVHSAMVLWAAAGIWLLVKGWPNILMIILGTFCLTIAWMVRPRYPKIPSGILERKDFPALYEIFDLICEKLHTSKVSGIVITSEFNASFTEVGLRRKKIIYVGLPLLCVLNGPEKVSVFSHEVAHGVNGDINRGIFVLTAVNTLVTFYSIIKPTRIYDSRYSVNGMTWLAGILMIPVNCLLLAISKIIYFLIYLLIHLFWQDSQRAEYLADYLAAQVSGTEAMLSTLEKLHYGEMFKLSVQKASLNKLSHDPFTLFEAEIQNMPERERERIKRVELLEGSRLDATHPPTVFRIESLKRHFAEFPGLQIMDSQFTQLDQELAVFREKISSELLRKYKESLYY